MPPKGKGKAKQSRPNAKSPGKKKQTALPSSPTKDSPDITAPVTGQKRKRPNSTGDPRTKQSKTRPLTAADIPDIVAAVVKAIPPADNTVDHAVKPRIRQIRRAKLWKHAAVVPEHHPAQTRRTAPMTRTKTRTLVSNCSWCGLCCILCGSLKNVQCSK